MPGHTRGPRKRSRKARSSRVAGSSQSARTADVRAAPSVHPRPPATIGSRERPRAPWHPLPLSEITILAGGIAAAVGLARGAGGVKLMLVGIAATALGTFEVTIREHRAGFRSHTLLLSFLPVVVFHSVVVLIVTAFTSFPPLLHLGLLAVDVALFFLAFRLLRRRFLDARARSGARSG